MPTYYEFFAGGGMARAGLGNEWECTFANDFDEMKGLAYRLNWGGDDLVVDDIANITPGNLPGMADLAWASSPCQDLSLAGNGGGLGMAGAEVMTRSGSFWHFYTLMDALVREDRAPRLIVFENVTGAITSNKGGDFKAIASVFANLGYNFGPLVIDASLFVPQSRKRLFIIGVRNDLEIPANLILETPNRTWHPLSLISAYRQLEPEVQYCWRWLDLPAPLPRQRNFIDVIEAEPQGVAWHTPEETQALLNLMSNVNLTKVKLATQAGVPMVGGIYRRMRDGVQRAEVRFDDVSGCLRTPSGGSSRQVILLVNGEEVRSRLLSPRESARLMGLPDEYLLPARYNDAYHLTGDGVVVPVVRHLAENILEPVLQHNDVIIGHGLGVGEIAENV